MASQYSELANRLDKLILFLDKYKETSWSKSFRNIKDLVESENRQGILLLIQSLRGGMGSFNDLIICKINGHAVAKEEENIVNMELMQLAEDVLSLAKQIRIEE